MPHTHSDASQRDLGAALGKVPSGLFILTARHGDRETGLLVSWVQQCAFDPPGVTVALKRGRDVGAWLTDGAEFTLNILGEGNLPLVKHFAAGFGPHDNAFAGLAARHRHAPHAPVLKEALAHLDLRVLARHAAGDHDLLVCQVVAGAPQHPGKPLTHVRNNGSHY